ncbi:MAG: aminopeptidase P family protein [Gemmatimonadetes bacterium]|nr:aminopeptidase P family protein [Gemmatimonadota bacterium]
MDHPARLRRLRELLLAAQGDAFLVSALPNVRYLTGFSGSNALVLVTQKQCVLFTDFRYESQVAEECGAAVEVRIEPSSLWAGLWTVLGADTTLRSVVFEAGHLTVRDMERCRAQGSQWTWRAGASEVETLRATKEPVEIDAIRRAGTVATAALKALLPLVRPGLSELEVCGLLERELRQAGSEAHPFPAIVASGERSALPHARPSARRLRRGDFLLLDFGATVDGYVSDITRTVVLGPPTEAQRAQHALVAAAQEAALRGLRAGMTGKAGDAIARSVIEAAGRGPEFGHSLGHGIGLEVHEDPRLSRLSELPLPEGTVVTVEPGVYSPGMGGVRIEDDVYLTAGGAELLTEFPRELLVIGE